MADDSCAPRAVPGARQRALLTALLLSGKVPLTCDALAEAVWDGSPPPGATTTLRSHIKRLRRALGPPAGARITACAPGYLISVEESELDVLRFERACLDASAARQAARWHEATSAAARALDLWRGPPLNDVPSQVLRDQVVPRLDQLRLQVLEDRAEADLRLGHHEGLIPQLRVLTVHHPFRESFHAQLMQALARADRQAEALDAYRHARRVLVDELGIEPGPHLQLLHQQILEGAFGSVEQTAGRHSDVGMTAENSGVPSGPSGRARVPGMPATDPRPATAPQLRVGAEQEARGADAVPAGRVGASAVVTPRELPGVPAGFVGRERELASMDDLLAPDVTCPGTVVISAIGGTAGVGKTALAVYWAHRAALHFPDGQLYVNLRGYDPDRPMTADEALAGFLRTLDVAGRDLPADEADRAARYRSLVAGRRMLIVLDNARSAEQVRPLLPGTHTCLAIVTSRDALAGLVARDGATRLDLDLLPPEDAIHLLRSLIGARVDADVAAAATLAAQCARLPLALRIAAEYAATRPTEPLANLVDELADERQRLNRLEADGDERSAIREVFSWSCRQVDADCQRAFQLAGLHPGSDLEQQAMAALASTGVMQAATMLDRLARVCLIQRAGPGRYRLHDLLRAYAQELACTRNAAEIEPALARLFDHYLQSAAAAMDILVPAESHRRPRPRRSAGPAQPIFQDVATAQSWLQRERSNLVAAAGRMTEGGRAQQAIEMAAIMFRYLMIGGHYSEAISLHGYALQAARALGDQAAEATALTNLAAVRVRQGSIRSATEDLQQALMLARGSGDRRGMARALHTLGNLSYHQGRFESAADYYQRSLIVYRELGDRTGEARTLNNLGAVHEVTGRYAEAAGHYREGVELHRQAGERGGEARALGNLGSVFRRQGRYEQALTCLEGALTLSRVADDRYSEAHVLLYRGDVRRCQGRHDEAAELYCQVLAILQAIGDRSGQAVVLNSLAESLLSTQADRAREHFAAALDLAGSTGNCYEAARAHHGLARAHERAGQPEQAPAHWHEALAQFTRMGTPEAAQICGYLDTPDGIRSVGVPSPS